MEPLPVWDDNNKTKYASGLTPEKAVGYVPKSGSTLAKLPLEESEK